MWSHVVLLHANRAWHFPSFIHSAFVLRENSKKVRAAHIIDFGPPNRGTGSKELTLKTIILLDDVLKLAKGQRTSKRIGVTAGYPMGILGLRDTTKGTLELYVQPLMPGLQGETFASCLDRCVGFQVSL